MALLSNVVKIKKTDYNSLVDAYPNSVTIGGVSRTYDPNTVYLIDDDNQYAYRNVNNYFTNTQTITNLDGSTDADICLNLENQNTDFPNRSLIGFYYDGDPLGSIGVYNISNSSAGERPVFWSPTYSFTKLLTGLDLFQDRFFAVQGDDFDSGDTWRYNGLYNRTNPSIGSTSLWYYFANYRYVIFELHNTNGHNVIAMPSLFFTNSHNSSSEAVRIDGYNTSGTRKAVQFYWNSSVNGITFTQNLNGGWFRVCFAIKNDENVHQ